MTQLYKYTAAFIAGFVLGLFAMYAVIGNVGAGFKPAQTDDPIITRHTVTHTAPIQALDKEQLKKRKILDRGNRVPVTSEILATGKVKGSDGTTTVAAVLDTTTGNTQLIENRKLAEAMSRNAIGITVEANPLGLRREVYYARTFGRVWDFYTTAGAGARIREDDKKEGFVRLNAEFRF